MQIMMGKNEFAISNFQFSDLQFPIINFTNELIAQHKTMTCNERSNKTTTNKKIKETLLHFLDHPQFTPQFFPSTASLCCYSKADFREICHFRSIRSLAVEEYSLAVVLSIAAMKTLQALHFRESCCDL